VTNQENNNNHIKSKTKAKQKIATHSQPHKKIKANTNKQNKTNIQDASS